MRAKMAMLLFTASLLPTVAVTWLSTHQMRTVLEKSSSDLLAARAAEVAERIDVLVTGYKRSVVRMAASPSVAAVLDLPASAGEVARARSRAILEIWPRTDPGLLGVAVLDPHGTVLMATTSALEGRNLAYRSFVAQSMRGETVVSDVHRSEPEFGNGSTLAFIAPIHGPGGVQRGMALFWVKGELLSRTLVDTNAQAGPGSFAVLFDHLGIRIAHSYLPDMVFRPARVLDPQTIEALVAERRFGADTRTLLEDTRYTSNTPYLGGTVPPNTPVFRAYAPGNKQWNYGAPRSLESVNWTVFYVVPENVLEANVAGAARPLIFLGATIAILALLAGTIFAAVILRPLRQLTGAARAMAVGNSATRVAMRRRDEFGTLAQTFDEMADRIEAQAQALLRDSELRYRQLIDSLKEGFCTLEVIYDGAGKAVDLRFLEVNPSFSVQSGLHGAPGKLMSELRAIEPEWLETYARIAATGESVHVERESQPLGRWFEVRAYRVGAPEAHIVAVLFNDVTEVREARRRQREQIERLNLLQQVTRAVDERHDLASIYHVVVQTLEDRLPADFACICRYAEADAQIEVLRVGPRSRSRAGQLQMLEQARIDVGTNGLSRCVQGELVHEPDLAQLSFAFPRRLLEAGLRTVVIAPLKVEGRVVGVLLAARTEARTFSSAECEFLRQLSEHVALAANQARLYGALHDAYEDLRRNQQAAAQQERLRALGQMSSGIAHDINNAISPAALYADALLEREKGLTSEGRRQLETIQRAVHDVAATLARMREFYRPREPQLEMVPVQLNDLVRQVVDMTRARWRDMSMQKGVTVELITHLQSPLPAIRGIESEIREALINLVFNAVDAMPRGGTLSLRTRAIGESVAVEVADTGVGMDEDARRRCLEPFFTTKGERGTGLGLAMVYGVVQRHGAEIEIESAPDRGTTMRLVFTAAECIVPTQPAAVPGTPVCLRILAIDDDVVLLRALGELLEADGHAVVAMHDSQRAVDCFRAALEGPEPFSVVITDLGMPYMDGRQVAAQVKAMSPATPVIMLTGWGQRMLADGDVPPFVDKMLSKPPRLRELRDALSGCCAT